MIRVHIEFDIESIKNTALRRAAMVAFVPVRAFIDFVGDPVLGALDALSSNARIWRRDFVSEFRRVWG